MGKRVSGVVLLLTSRRCGRTCHIPDRCYCGREKLSVTADIGSGTGRVTPTEVPKSGSATPTGSVTGTALMQTGVRALAGVGAFAAAVFL
jgi:hypothetical protein